MAFDKIEQAELEIQNTYGDRVSVAAKKKSLIKFGRNEAVGTSFVTVSHVGGSETYATTNAIDSFSSSSAADTMNMVVEGHTVSGTGADAVFTFVTQTVTLVGQTETLLTTPVARVSRAYTVGSAPAGDVYIYENDTVTAGVPQTPANIHLKILGSAGQAQSFKAATTFSGTDYGIITAATFGIDKKTTATCEFEIQIRKVGDIFRPAAARVALASAGQSSFQVQFEPCLIVPKNADIRIMAVASTTNVEVDASFSCYIAAVQVHPSPF